MRLFSTFRLLALVGCWSGMAFAQLKLLPDKGPRWVFGGGPSNLSLVFSNTGDQTVEADVGGQLIQAGSATAIQFGEVLRKTIQILPGQTVVESAQIILPPVKVETRFVIQWLENTNHVFGTTEVVVYPTNLLAELKTLAGGGPLGVLDPQNQLKPLLKASGVEIEDLEQMELDAFSGKLAITGPFRSPNDMTSGLAERVIKLARKGVAIVWIQPPRTRPEKLEPSFYMIPEGQGSIVVAQPELISDLASRPQSQRNLVDLARRARQPSPTLLPGVRQNP